MRKHSKHATFKAAYKILIFLSFLLMCSLGEAHKPSDMTLIYDMENQSLNVTIKHSVSNPSEHYVVRVELFKNDLQMLSKEYASQPTSSVFTYSYQLNASAGDLLMARAICSIAGSNTGEIIVTNDSKLVIQSASSLPLEKIELHEGFEIELFAQNLTYPRSWH